jgi:uncharacterized phage protein (TIGR01671 family)
MKEIKFRAWDKRKQIMVYQNENDSAGYWDGVHASEIELVNSILRDSSYEFMQYTGLKDSDGKEIYADDILEVEDSNGVICRTVVEYIEGAFRVDKWYPKEPTSVEHVNYTGDWEQVEVDIEDYEFLGVVLQHHLEFKVVGNRHEHHYLLGGEEE